MQVTADGIFTSDVGELVDVRCSTRLAPGFGGHDLATWRFQPNGAYRGRDFNPAANVRIAHNGATVFEGEFTGARPVGDGMIEAQARGYGHRLEDLLSLYFEANPGDIDELYPTNQLFQGILPDPDFQFGWEYAEDTWGTPDVYVSDTIRLMLAAPFGDDGHAANQIVTLAQVLTGVLQEQNHYWAVWRKVLEVYDRDDLMDQTPIVWDAPEEFIGIQAEDYRTRIYTWVKVPTSGDNPRGYSMGDSGSGNADLTEFDPKVGGADYRGLGEQSDLSRANDLALSTLMQLKGRYIFESGLTIEQNMNFPEYAPLIRAGRALKLNHLRTSMGTLVPESDSFFIIGQTELSWSSDTDKWTQRLTPMGSAPRDLGQILAGVPGDSGPAITDAA